MAASFDAQVSRWVAQTKQRLRAVRNIAVEKVVEIAQTPVGAGGNLPIDTGFLRASIRFSSDGNIPLQIYAPRTKQQDAHVQAFRNRYDPGDLALVLIGAELRDTITVAWAANYAKHVEYGANGRPGRAFMRLAAQQWQGAVAEASREVQGRDRR